MDAVAKQATSLTSITDKHFLPDYFRIGVYIVVSFFFGGGEEEGAHFEREWYQKVIEGHLLHWDEDFSTCFA